MLNSRRTETQTQRSGRLTSHADVFHVQTANVASTLTTVIVLLKGAATNLSESPFTGVIISEIKGRFSVEYSFKMPSVSAC